MLKYYEYIDRDGDMLNIYPSAGQERSVCLWVGGSGVVIPADKVEEVCDKLRKVAGLPPVWTVEKKTVSAPPVFDDEGRIKVNVPESWWETEKTRDYANALLAAADEAEKRANNKTKLPTAWGSMVLPNGINVKYQRSWQAWLPESEDRRILLDKDLERMGFTVLYDPDK